MLIRKCKIFPKRLGWFKIQILLGTWIVYNRITVIKGHINVFSVLYKFPRLNSKCWLKNLYRQLKKELILEN